MDTKKWWTSKATWAGIVTTIAGIIALIDANFGTNFTHQGWYGFLVSLGGIFGVTGRVTANSIIEKKLL